MKNIALAIVLIVIFIAIAVLIGLIFRDISKKLKSKEDELAKYIDRFGMIN